MPRRSNLEKKPQTWEVNAFNVAIMLARVHPVNIFVGYENKRLHKFTSKELVDYCSQLKWGSDLDLRVGLAELMQGTIIFNGRKNTLENFFHLKVEESGKFKN